MSMINIDWQTSAWLLCTNVCIRTEPNQNTTMLSGMPVSTNSKSRIYLAVCHCLPQNWSLAFLITYKAVIWTMGLVSKYSRNIDANQTMWNFLLQQKCSLGVKKSKLLCRRLMWFFFAWCGDIFSYNDEKYSLIWCIR